MWKSICPFYESNTQYAKYSLFSPFVFVDHFLYPVAFATGFFYF